MNILCRRLSRDMSQVISSLVWASLGMDKCGKNKLCHLYSHITRQDKHNRSIVYSDTLDVGCWKRTLTIETTSIVATTSTRDANNKSLNSTVNRSLSLPHNLSANLWLKIGLGLTAIHFVFEDCVIDAVLSLFSFFWLNVTVFYILFSSLCIVSDCNSINTWLSHKNRRIS